MPSRWYSTYCNTTLNLYCCAWACGISVDWREPVTGRPAEQSGWRSPNVNQIQNHISCVIFAAAALFIVLMCHLKCVIFIKQIKWGVGQIGRGANHKHSPFKNAIALHNYNNACQERLQKRQAPNFYLQFRHEATRLRNNFEFSLSTQTNTFKILACAHCIPSVARGCSCQHTKNLWMHATRDDRHWEVIVDRAARAKNEDKTPWKPKNRPGTLIMYTHTSTNAVYPCNPLINLAPSFRHVPQQVKKKGTKAWIYTHTPTRAGTFNATGHVRSSQPLTHTETQLDTFTHTHTHTHTN